MKPLPYKFVDQRLAIWQDAQRVQRLSPAARGEALLGFLSEGETLAAHCPDREAAWQLRLTQRRERRRALRSLLARHGH